MLCNVSLYAQNVNCRMTINLTDKTGFQYLYINSEASFYYVDTIGIDTDSLCLSVNEPQQAILFINNDAERAFQFYLDEGKYTLNVDCKNRTANVIGSLLNDEFKEMMRVHDSLFKQYNIMHAMLYPYNGMDRDSAHAWLQKYLPLCDSLSKIHSNNFYETHLSSFLTLEHIYNDLSYTFDDPGYDTIEYDVKKLKILFDRLDPKLKKYKIYDECVAMFIKERIVPPKIAKPLFNYDAKN